MDETAGQDYVAACALEPSCVDSAQSYDLGLISIMLLPPQALIPFLHFFTASFWLSDLVTTPLDRGVARSKHPPTLALKGWISP